MSKIFFCQKALRKENTVIKPHSHACNEIVFYGYGCNGATKIAEIEYTIKTGDIAVIPKNVTHEELHRWDGELIFVGFDCENLPPAGIYSNLEHLAPAFEDIINEMSRQEPFFERAIECNIQKILIHLLRNEGSTPNCTRDLSYCKHFIAENCSDKINFSHLAASISYSTDHFRHLFIKKYGVSPKGYQIEQRLEKAKKILAENKISCTETAYICGFSDSGQMSKMFKAKYGITPLEMRKAYK